MGGFQLEIANIHHFAKGVERGTKPHVIMGRPVLKFFKEGRWRIARKVDHPGTKPTWFLRDALTQSREDLKRLMKQYLGR